MRGRTRTLVRASLVLVMVTGLAACGRRGGLEPPPDPSVQAPVADAADPGVSVLRRPKSVPITPPHEPFILDPLL